MADTYLTFEITPDGERHGNGKRPTYCRWRGIYRDFLEVGILNIPSGSPTVPNVFFTVRGRGCLHRSARTWLETARDLIQRLGGAVLWEKLSRVDIALDLPGQSIAPFVQACQENRYITRCRHTLITGTGTTVMFRTKAGPLRIYDKIAQLECQAKTATRHEMIARRWGGVEPQDAIRVEFQVNRPVLTAHGIDTPDDYFNKRQALVRYLTEKRFRFTARPVDRASNNQARAGVLPLWGEVSAAMQLWATSSDHDLTPLPKQEFDPTLLLMQIGGVLATIADGRGLDWAKGPTVMSAIAMEAIARYLSTTRRKPLAHIPGGSP